MQRGEAVLRRVAIQLLCHKDAPCPETPEQPESTQQDKSGSLRSDQESAPRSRPAGRTATACRPWGRGSSCAQRRREGNVSSCCDITKQRRTQPGRNLAAHRKLAECFTVSSEKAVSRCTTCRWQLCSCARATHGQETQQMQNTLAWLRLSSPRSSAVRTSEHERMPTDAHSGTRQIEHVHQRSAQEGLAH